MDNAGDYGPVGADSLHIRLFQVRIMALDESWNARSVQSSFWRFYMNSAGGAVLELDSGLYPLDGGRLYLVPRGVRFSCRNTAPLTHVYAHFDVIGLPGLAARRLLNRPVRLPESAPLEEEARAAAAALAGSAAGVSSVALWCRVKGLLYRTLAHYLESLPAEQMGQLGRAASRLEPVLPALRFVEQNLAHGVTNRSLAGLCGMSEDYFIRRFRECVGQTPAQYIIEQRIVMAAQALLFTDLTIEQIAAQMGFGNRFYLARVFARHLGLSPAAYRGMSRV